MAISRLWQSGFELGNYDGGGWGLTNEFDALRSNQALNFFSIVTTPKKTGTYSLGLDVNNNGCSGITNISATRQIRTGFHFQQTQIYSGDYWLFWQLIDAGSNSIVALGYDERSSRLVIYTGSGYTKSVHGPPIILNNWYHFGIDVKIDNAAGWISVYKDGIKVMTLTGNTGNVDIEKAYLGTFPRAGAGVGYPGAVYWDDYYIDDTTGESDNIVPDLRFELLSPDGAGNYTNWTPSVGNNYECVDEIPPNDDTDYVLETATAQKDSYTLQDFTMPSGATIQAVIPIALARKDSAVDCKLKMGTRLAGTDLMAASGGVLAIDYSIPVIFERQTTKPGGGAWGDADVDGAEVVIESDGTFA